MPDSGRLVPLQGSQNFRDLGGYAAAEGRRVRWGRVYRSDGLGELSAADLARLARRGLRLVCDLRSVEEVEETPDRLPEGATYLHLPIGDAAVQPRKIRERFDRGDVEGLDEGFMVEAYRKMLGNGAAQFGAALRAIAQAEGAPLVFHCTAGKDRTGLLAALLLDLLGVSREDVLEDYVLTEHATRERIAGLRRTVAERGFDPDPLMPLFGAPRSLLVGTLSYVAEQWGSSRGYLEAEAGIREEHVVALRGALLEVAE